MSAEYDVIIAGSGLFGAVCARELTDLGKRCLVIEKRPHIAGNCFTENIAGVQVHRYGAHIFHTGNRTIWEYVNRFASFRHFVHSPIANYKGELYNLPFNMHTFYQLWGVTTAEEAKEKIRGQRSASGITHPKNLEERAISLVGRDAYEILIKGYTEKQWGRPCNELPAFIIDRIPVRFRFDNNYFDDPWQGIPADGYTNMIQQMLDGIEVRLNTDYLSERSFFDRMTDCVIYTGEIDRYFDYRCGELEWRSLRFETELLEKKDFQGTAVVNFTDAEVPYTRITEHKHFASGEQEKTVITREYPHPWQRGREAYYPVNDEKNQRIYKMYETLAKAQPKVIFGGRLGQYRYFNMDQVIAEALDTVQMLAGEKRK